MLFWYLVFFVLLFNLLTCALRLYGKGNSADWEGRFYHITWMGVQGYLTESLSTLVVIFLWVADWLRGQIRRLISRRKSQLFSAHAVDRPVILCHGYCMRGWTMAVLAFWLRTMGRSTVIMPTFFSVKSGIRDYASQLTGVIQDVLDKTGADAVDLVGHSMGGLAARACVVNAVLDGRSDISVAHVVTLASPHCGTPNWVFTWGRCGLDMKPGSSFLESLKDEPFDLNSTNIFSPFDAIVPEESAGSWDASTVRKVQIEKVGHISMVMLPSVARQVFEALKS